MKKMLWIVYFSSPSNEEVILWRLEMMLSLFKGDNIPEIDSTPSFDQVLVTFNIYFQIYPYFQYKVHKWTVVSKFQNSRNCGFSVVASAEDGGSPGGSLEGAGGGGSKVSWPLWRLSCWQWGHWNVYVGHHTVIVEVGSRMALLFPPFGGLTLSWEEYFFALIDPSSFVPVWAISCGLEFFPPTRFSWGSSSFLIPCKNSTLIPALRHLSYLKVWHFAKPIRNMEKLCTIWKL